MTNVQFSNTAFENPDKRRRDPAKALTEKKNHTAKLPNCQIATANFLRAWRARDN